MADTILTDLAEYSGVLAPDDWVYLVDASATPPAGSYKIQVKNLGARILLQEIINTSAGQFDFGPALAGGIIPAGFNKLVIEGELRSNAAVSLANVCSIFNADTTSTNYYSQLTTAYGASTGGGAVGQAAAFNAATCTGASSPTDSYTFVRMEIFNYTGNRLKSVLSNYCSLEIPTGLRVGSQACVWDFNNALTRIRIQTDNHPVSQLFGVLRLYGEM
jgi:hypothetical protein